MPERLPVVLLAICLAACGAPPPEVTRDESAALQTHQLRYEARRAPGGVEFTIPFTYRNRSADSLFLVNCQYGTRVGNRTVQRVDLSMELQKKADGTWTKAWEAITSLCLSPAVWIAPGAAYSDTMRIFGGKPGRAVAPELAVQRVAGEYRLVWQQLRRATPSQSYPDGDTLPTEARVSNSFVLTGGW
ncbi:MAG TPA: hypothetical protein VF665_15855 [Longimicrobium sp.]|jgi:hypothetical protein|uniref:hypothetical protein n=1 Tax=Longimicrobium sp. TaxID=2029185 RepID=UPI002EDAB468